MLLNKNRGFTLIEILVTLAILAILAAVALPYAETMIRRGNEMELRSALRTIRGSIDDFHNDWKGGKIPSSCGCYSETGYPKTLLLLVDGIDTGSPGGQKIRYLRRIPRDPFAPQSLKTHEQWGLLSYNDSPDSVTWGGEDVYDVHSLSDKRAKDGSLYADW